MLPISNTSLCQRIVLVCWSVAIFHATSLRGEKITDHVDVTLGGAVNQVTLRQDGARLAVYQADSNGAQQLLLTHHRRDVISAARHVAQGTRIVAPHAERDLIENPQGFWDAFTSARFHDYAQRTTKILAEPLVISRWVKEGDSVAWNDLEFRVIETPGYTPGSISFVTTVDDTKIAFTGDLIYGDGKILDLYSFQDAIPQASVRGYHGYGSRLAQLVTSLEKIARQQPDVIIPARGPVIRDPPAAINRLLERARSLYGNYLSTSALHWYFKEQRMRTCGERILGRGAEIKLMPYSRHQKTPDWVLEHATSRLIISDNGHGFLLDCGYQRVIDAVNKLISTGLVREIDGIFVTHFHDDHTDMVQAAADEFQCPVYALREYADVLENPNAYHLPAMTSRPIVNVREMTDGQKMDWQEYEFTFHFFPGQTYYHGAMLVRRADEKPVFFIGDSLAPSGIDDYCVQNRNLAHADSGYQLCFKKLRQLQTKQNIWLVNEHIPFVFEFSGQEMDYLESRYRQRVEMLRELFPWDDPNYGIDERWAAFYPYGVQAKQGETIDLEIRITNHSPHQRTFTATPRGSAGIQVRAIDTSVTLDARTTGAIQVTATAESGPGNYLITSDIKSDGMEFLDWIEALVTIK